MGVEQSQQQVDGSSGAVDGGEAVRRGPVSTAVNNVRQHGLLNTVRSTSSWALLSYEQLCDSILQLNALTCKYRDHQCRSIMFKIKKGTDDTFLWRTTIRIHCIKVIGELGDEAVAAGASGPLEIAERRLLTLRQYMSMHNAIVHQVAGVAATSAQCHSTASVDTATAALDVSVIMNKCVSRDCGEEADSDNQCSICMERGVDVVLACTHEYCLPCIEQWNVNSNTCPECRRRMKLDDSLVVLDKPEEGEVQAHLVDYLSKITHQRDDNT